MKAVNILFLLLTINISAFSQSFTMSINSVDASGENMYTTINDIYILGEKIAMIPRSVEGKADAADKIILDKSKYTITRFQTVNGKKIATVVKVPEMRSIIGKYDEMLPETHLKIESTQDIKEIEGMTSIKMLIEDDNHKSTVWVTNATDLILMEIFKLMQLHPDPIIPADITTYGVGGFPLIIKVDDRNGKQQLLMTISDFSATADKKVFSTEGYELVHEQ